MNAYSRAFRLKHSLSKERWSTELSFFISFFSVLTDGFNLSLILLDHLLASKQREIVISRQLLRTEKGNEKKRQSKEERKHWITSYSRLSYWLLALEEHSFRWQSVGREPLYGWSMRSSLPLPFPFQWWPSSSFLLFSIKGKGKEIWKERTKMPSLMKRKWKTKRNRASIAIRKRKNEKVWSSLKALRSTFIFSSF